MAVDGRASGGELPADPTRSPTLEPGLSRAEMKARLLDRFAPPGENLAAADTEDPADTTDRAVEGTAPDTSAMPDAGRRRIESKLDRLDGRQGPGGEIREPGERAASVDTEPPTSRLERKLALLDGRSPGRMETPGTAANPDLDDSTSGHDPDRPESGEQTAVTIPDKLPAVAPDSHDAAPVDHPDSDSDTGPTRPADTSDLIPPVPAM